MIHFIRSDWLWLLIPAFLYVLWIIHSTRENNPWKKVCDPHLLDVLVQSQASTSRFITNIILLLFFMLGIFTLAGPSWDKVQLPIYRDTSAMMLVLDLSSVMQSTDIKPDRLSRAKFKIRDLINTAQNMQMGLVAFTDEAFVASPLSKDANTLNALLDELHPQMMPISGSDISQGLTQGLTLLKQAAATTSPLLLITGSEPTANSWTIAQTIASAGGHLNILAMVESNAAMQSTIAHLQQLAQVGNGHFQLFTADATDVHNILSANNSKQSIKDDNQDQAIFWRDAGPWFCLLMIPFALLVLRGGARYGNIS